MRVHGLLQGFKADQKGTTAIEYSVIAAGVGIAILVSVNAVGTNMMNIYYNKLINMF
jgi:Flp pilus assembly pilin Flp